MIKILALISIIPLGLGLMYATIFVKTHGIGRIILRFVSGMHLDGQHRTDAGFLVRGTKVRHHSGRASRWAHLPHAYRAAVRWAFLFAMALTGYGFTQNRTDTKYGLMFGGVILVILSLIWVTRKGRSRYHHKSMHTPLALTLAGVLQTTPQVVSSSLTVRPDYSKVKSGEYIGALILPDWFAATPAERESVGSLFDRRLGIETRLIWHTDNHPMSVDVMRAQIPPTMVPWREMLPEIHKLGEHEVMLGITGDGSHKVWDMNADEPHALGSAQTRRGKTSLAMLVMAQVLKKGGWVIAVDPKRVGLDEFVAGHPRAKVYAEPREVKESMWAPIREFHKILNERIDAYKEDRTIQFDRYLLVVDEVSIWAGLSKTYWDSIKTGKEKATPPIFNTLAECLYAGAQFRMNVMVFGQVLGHNVLGNAIESFGMKMLGGYTKQAYMRLIGITPIPVSQRARGRFLIYDGGDYPQWTQLVYGSIQELRQYALEPYAGTPGVPREDSPVTASAAAPAAHKRPRIPRPRNPAAKGAESPAKAPADGSRS